VYFLQVLQGESPFRDIPDTALGHYVLNGMRPDKPGNASAIGFSDMLWDFTEQCWHGRIKSRPEVGEVVRHLEEAVVNWNGLMPPCVQAEVVASGSEETSDTKEHCESDILIFPLYYVLSNGTDGRFRSPQDPTSGVSIGSQTASWSSSLPSGPPTQSTNQRQWEDVTNATNATEAIRALAKILIDKEGRDFALRRLEPEAAKPCIETLDYVSCDIDFPFRRLR